MRPRPRTSGLGPFDQLSRRPKQTDQHPARTEGTSRALAEELSQREGQIGRDLRIEPRAASSGDGGVVLFLDLLCFIYMEEICRRPRHSPCWNVGWIPFVPGNLSSPRTVPGCAPPDKPSAPYWSWGALPSRASYGLAAASKSPGRVSTSCIRARPGILTRYSRPCCKRVSPSVLEN